MEEFIKKISSKFSVNDFKQMRTKEGFIQLLKNWGCPEKMLQEITDENWEKYTDIIYNNCI
jgi:hypothetical protein